MYSYNVTPLNLGKRGTAVLVQLWTAVIFLDQYTGVVRQTGLGPGPDSFDVLRLPQPLRLATLIRVLGLSHGTIRQSFDQYILERQ